MELPKLQELGLDETCIEYPVPVIEPRVIVALDYPDKRQALEFVGKVSPDECKLKILKETPKLLNVIKAEKKATKEIVKTHNISGIISDNRFGVYNKNVPSIFITHQLQVLSGMTTWLRAERNGAGMPSPLRI